MKMNSGYFYSVAAFNNRTLRFLLCATLACFFYTVVLPCSGQQAPLGPLSEPAWSDPLLTSTVQPGTAFLFDLERKFAAAVAEGGGAAFASYFDKDGITLANRQSPQIGQAAIAAHATWSPNTYQLTWKPDGGELSAAGDMGYTWGHYEGRSLGPAAAAGAVEHGRYMTVWKREPDGVWKVVMDSSNEDPPEAECKCSVNGTP
jgi:ketosteroid isomerase-like protein